MINFGRFRSLEEALADALQNPSGLKYLANLTDDKIQSLSHSAVAEDWYHDLRLIENSIREIWKITSADSFIAHAIWCAHREAQWMLKSERLKSLNIAYQQPEHLLQTLNKPTVIVTPMTLCTHDAMYVILSTLQEFMPERQLVVYGEDMQSYLQLHPDHIDLFAQDTLPGIIKIIKTLKSGGVFLTYPDFVYRQHAGISGQLFGLNRSFSAGFLTITLKSAAELLPLSITRCADTLNIRFFPSIKSNKSDEFLRLPVPVCMQLQCLLVSKVLEGLIFEVPNQWRLLPTLTHESEGMA